MDKQINMMILIAACFVCLLPVTQATISVSVDVSSQMAHPGDNITVVCRMTGGDMSTVVYLYKEIMKDDAKVIRELVSTGEVLTPLYTFLNRFKMDKSDAGSAVLFVVHISNVTVNDSGHYGCYVHEQSDAYDSERMEVYKQPDDVFFTNYTRGDIIDIEENQPMDLVCNVMGVVPSPEVKIVLVGVNHEDDFTRRTHLKALCEGSFGQKENCPLHFQYDVSLSNPAFLPEKISDGDQISCQAFIPHARYRPVVRTHTIRYRFSPKFNCESAQYASLHEKHAHISCNVTYRPEPIEIVWTFTVDGMDYEVRPPVQLAYNSPDFSAEQKDITETSSVIMLTIAEVEVKHFTNYHLTVYHELGNNTMDFTLSEFQETPPTGGVSVVTSSVLVFMLTSLISSLVL